MSGPEVEKLKLRAETAEKLIEDLQTRMTEIKNSYG